MPKVIELAGCVARTGGGAANHIIVPIEDYIINNKPITYQEVKNLKDIKPGTAPIISDEVLPLPQASISTKAAVSTALKSTQSYVAQSKEIAQSLEGTNLDGAYIFKNAEGKWCALHAKFNDSFPGVQEESVFKGLESAGVLDPQQKQKALNQMVRARCLTTYDILAKAKGTGKPPSISSAGYYDDKSKFLGLAEIIARLQCGTATDNALHDGNAKYDKTSLHNRTLNNDCDILNKWCVDNGSISYNGENRTVFEHLTDTPVLCTLGDTDIKLMFLNAPNAAGASRPGTGAFIETDMNSQNYQNRIDRTYQKADALLQKKGLLGKDSIIVTTSIGGGAYAGKDFWKSQPAQATTDRVNSADVASKNRSIFKQSANDAQIIVRRKGKDPLSGKNLGFDIKTLIPEMIQGNTIPNHIYNGVSGTVYSKGQPISAAPAIIATTNSTPSKYQSSLSPPLALPASSSSNVNGSKIIEIVDSTGKTAGGSGLSKQQLNGASESQTITGALTPIKPPRIPKFAPVTSTPIKPPRTPKFAPVTSTPIKPPITPNFAPVNLAPFQYPGMLNFSPVNLAPFQFPGILNFSPFQYPITPNFAPVNLAPFQFPGMLNFSPFHIQQILNSAPFQYPRISNFAPMPLTSSLERRNPITPMPRARDGRPIFSGLTRMPMPMKRIF